MTTPDKSATRRIANASHRQRPISERSLSTREQNRVIVFASRGNKQSIASEECRCSSGILVCAASLLTRFFMVMMLYIWWNQPMWNSRAPAPLPRKATEHLASLPEPSGVVKDGLRGRRMVLALLRVPDFWRILSHRRFFDRIYQLSIDLCDFWEFSN